jgi:hypothetical protein
MVATEKLQTEKPERGEGAVAAAFAGNAGDQRPGTGDINSWSKLGSSRASSHRSFSAKTPRRSREGGWPIYQLPMNGDDTARKNGSASIGAMATTIVSVVR